MKWYIAKLIYRVTCSNGNHTAQFDEQLRIVQANDDLHAFHKARLIGEQPVILINIAPVAWKFIDVIEIICLSDSTDGDILNSIIKEEKSSAAYMKQVNKKANQLLQDSLQQFILSN